MPLCHFSEDPGIRLFQPRIAPTSSIQDEAFVWAIDEWHAPMYYLPRDCPRACFWPGPETTPDDVERWFAGINARMVIAVELAWLERIRTTTLYRPLAVEPVGDLLGALAGANVELRITPALLDMWSLVIGSTLEFSGTRLRNAQEYAG